MAPLCQIEMTLLRVSESREKRHDGAVDMQAGIHPARRVTAVQSGRLCVVDACELMGVHRRQVFRLLRGLKQDGAPSLLSKRRVDRAVIPDRDRDRSFSGEIWVAAAFGLRT
jgi:hypothetical protein